MNGTSAPLSKKTKTCDAKDELSAFDDVFTRLMDECLNEGDQKKCPETGDAIQHFLRVCMFSSVAAILGK